MKGNESEEGNEENLRGFEERGERVKGVGIRNKVRG